MAVHPDPTTDPTPQGGHFEIDGPRHGWLSPLNQRRWRNFKKNRRAFWSLWLFLALYFLSLLAPVIANEKPLLVRSQGEYYVPILYFYPEVEFGGDFQTEAVYRDIEVECLIISGGLEDCWDDPEDVIEVVQETGQFAGNDVDQGWVVWPLIPYRYNTINDLGRPAPSPPDADHWLGTDDTSRDVLARVIYGFRLSVTFAFVVTFFASIIGIAMGAIQGFAGGFVDLVLQRIIEIWNATPSLYIIIIISAIAGGMTFFWLALLMVLFGWTGLVGVVRAEFLRARNFEYVRAARALGVSNGTIMFRHVLPNAMVATLTFLPFILTGTIGGLASLDFLGFGLPSSAPSLGEMTLQAKNNLTAPWLGFTAFFTFAIMLSLLVFVFEGVRDAFDPRKTFS